MEIDDVSGTALVAGTVPERVAMQIINNSCNDDSVEDSESLTTGSVKGLSKVLDGFGIPYDEHADNFTLSPQPVTDDSETANKERGIGYMGVEAHYPQELASGQEHSPDHPEQPVEPGGMFPNLTTEEEKYGIAMRWEYYKPDNSGSAIDGYLNFLRGDGTSKQYVAVHATNTDKWVICCPYDWGPALNLPTTGGGKYAHGRIGGVSPQAAEDLGITGGDGPENAMTECWWVENSSQVKCGPVNDLSELTKGSSSGGSGTASGTTSGTTGTGSSGTGTSTSTTDTTKAAVTTANTAKVLTLAMLASGSRASGDGSVKVAPANPNSFIDEVRTEFGHGEMPNNTVKYITIRDTESGVDNASAIIQARIADGKGIAPHFIIDKQGKIYQCVAMGQHGGRPGDAEKVSYDIDLVREQVDGSYPQTQMNALDKLISYIDDYLGFEPEIVDRKEQDATQAQKDEDKDKEKDGDKDKDSGTSGSTSSDFPSDSYDKSRNHNGVKTEEDAEQAKAMGACSDGTESDDSDGSQGALAIAAKAVEIAGTASPEDAISANGTENKPTDSRLDKYVSEKERVYPGDDYWSSCCRCSATAIKASGADEDWPLGPPSSMYDYAAGATDKWENVGTWRAGDSADVLKPGDVLITQANHIKIFVGNEAVKKKFASSDANMYSGSATDHYPWCYNESTSGDSREYGIFRLKGGKDSTAGGTATGARGKIIEFAKTQIGVSYNYGPGGGTGGSWENDVPNQQLACNGLTYWAYDAAGIEVPRGSIDQMTDMPTITSTGSVSSLKPGDIVCWDDVGRRSDIQYPIAAYRHVAIYAGNGDIIESVPNGGVGQRALQDNEFSFGGSWGNLGDGGDSSSGSKDETKGSKSKKKTKSGSTDSKSSSKSSGDTTGAAKELVEKAYSIIGSGYSWSGYNWTGDVSTSVFTCSGVPDYCLGLPSHSNNPESFWAQIESAGNFTTDISKLKVGDLVFYPYGGRVPCGHVGIYIGDNKIIDSIPNAIGDIPGGVQIRDVNYMQCLGGGPIVEGGGSSFNKDSDKSDDDEQTDEGPSINVDVHRT